MVTTPHAEDGYIEEIIGLQRYQVRLLCHGCWSASSHLQVCSVVVADFVLLWATSLSPTMEHAHVSLHVNTHLVSCTCVHCGRWCSESTTEMCAECTPTIKCSKPSLVWIQLVPVSPYPRCSEHMWKWTLRKIAARKRLSSLNQRMKTDFNFLCSEHWFWVHLVVCNCCTWLPLFSWLVLSSLCYNRYVSAPAISILSNLTKFTNLNTFSPFYYKPIRVSKCPLYLWNHNFESLAEPR